MGQTEGGRKIFRPLVVNLYGGPGAGKSTTAAHLFALLKHEGVNCELVTEYTKDKVWEESLGVLQNQVYILGKQYHRMAAPAPSVDVLITDSPLLLGLIYGENESAAFKALVWDLHNRFSNWDVYLTRGREYQQAGRLQTEEDARAIDVRIRSMLTENEVIFTEYKAGVELPGLLVAVLQANRESGPRPYAALAQR